MTVPAHAKTVDALLQTMGSGLSSFIAERRNEGMSYRLIARDLYEFTDGVVDVTHQTISNWVEALTEKAKAS